MYAECAFCAGSLGGDGGESGLGVGRRFAFDPWKSRAWVICARCGRWNLTPFDSRLEAVEALERLAGGGRVALTSEQVTLLRAGALDVVRIGRPPRTELATWRYGERLKARQRETLRIYVPVAVVAVSAGIALNALAGGGIAAMMGNLPGAIDGITRGIIGNRRIRIEPPVCERCGRIMHLRSRHLAHARLGRTTHTDLALLLSCPHCRSEGAMIQGPDAERALRTGMTWINLRKKKAIRKKAEAAAEYLERHGGPERYVATSISMERTLGQFAGAEALALEMAVDEQAEVRELERRWHEAEELAAIADNLLPDPLMDEKLRLARARTGPQPPQSGS
jgi:hypothetical protein